MIRMLYRLIALILLTVMITVSTFAADVAEGFALLDVMESQLKSFAFQNTEVVEASLASNDPVSYFLDIYWNTELKKRDWYADQNEFISANKYFVATMLLSDELKAEVQKTKETKIQAEKDEEAREAAHLAATVKLAEQNALDYSRAEMMQQAGLFDEAAALYLRLGDYRDAAQRMGDCQIIQQGIKYLEADVLMVESKYLSAYENFIDVPGFQDADARAQEALQAFINEIAGKAVQAFSSSPVNFSSYNELIREMNAVGKMPGDTLDIYHAALFEIGNAALQAKEHETALNLFEFLFQNGFMGAETKFQEAQTLAQSIVSITGGTYPFFIQMRGSVTGPAIDVYPDSILWEDVVDAGSNLFYSVALHKDGTVSVAANPHFYQGGGLFSIPLPDLAKWTGMKSISVGANHVAGINKQGLIFTAGSDSYGQLDFAGMRTAAEISTGLYHTLLQKDSLVYAFGSHLFNQSSLSGKTKFSAVAAGAYHSLALLPGGSVRAAGLNADGQCEVKEWKGVTSIAAGAYHSVGLKNNGTVVATGLNDYGQCEVDSWSDVLSISAGNTYTLGLKRDGTVISTAKGGKYLPFSRSAWMDLPASQWKNMMVDDSKNTLGLIGAEVGSIVYFGTYERDNDTSNGPEKIAWRVLSIDSEKALLISEMNLDYMPYHSKPLSISWETCDLRKWLNDYFLMTMFTDEERDSLVLANNSNEKNSYYKTTGGKATQDFIFLLSEEEANKLFRNTKDRIAKNTAFAVAQSMNTDANMAGWWWLRSPGGLLNRAVIVSNIGDLRGYGIMVSYIRAVRPALWVNLE